MPTDPSPKCSSSSSRCVFPPPPPLYCFHADFTYHKSRIHTSQDDYIQQRSSAIESIESTISELGQIFTQLAHMVAEQRETVQRIDADTIDIASNVSGAQRELLKYFASISSNRWLMLKLFGVLIVFVSLLLSFPQLKKRRGRMLIYCAFCFCFLCHARDPGVHSS